MPASNTSTFQESAGQRSKTIPPTIIAAGTQAVSQESMRSRRSAQRSKLPATEVAIPTVRMTSTQFML